MTAQYNIDGDVRLMFDKPELVCDRGGMCTCEVGYDELKTLYCKNATYVDELFDKPLFLETANVQVADDRFDPEIVDLSHNQISELDKGRVVPGHEDTILKIDLGSNAIQSIEEGVFDGFGKLKVLILSDNYLTGIDLRKDWLTEKLGNSLRLLALDDNHIRTLPERVFDSLKNLKRLVLDRNFNLRITSRTFGSGLAKLEELSLDYCNLTNIENGTFAALTSLKALSLRGNPLATIPYAVNAIPTLMYLDLSESTLYEFNRHALRKDIRLEKLFMQRMPYLYSIDDCAFCGLTSLKAIDFSNSTQLYAINTGAFGALSTSKDYPQRLVDINFANCNLSSLEEHLLKWEIVERLSIGGNRFNCNAGLAWLMTNWTAYSFSESALPSCAAPPELKGMTFDRAVDYMRDGPLISAIRRNVLLVVLALLGIFTFVLAAVLAACCRKRIPNIFYRLEFPQNGYKQLDKTILTG
ncbi:Protein LRON-7 b [Aphelenchoides avenae]|nr:Protein LRON-7 b [Aphelenchus avenae]